MIKVKKRKILLLPGDGIGPEVVAEVKKIIEWFNKKKSLDFETEEDLVGRAQTQRFFFVKPFNNFFYFSNHFGSYTISWQ
jgi:hypothetical protein